MEDFDVEGLVVDVVDYRKTPREWGGSRLSFFGALR